MPIAPCRLTARGTFFPAAEVMRIIEGAALEKLNVLHWHLSDDQGWRVESERFPRLNECGGGVLHEG